MDVVILLAIAGFVILLLVALALLKRQSSANEVGTDEPQPRQVRRPVEAGPGARRRVVAANRNRQQQRVVEEEDEDDEPAAPEIELPEGKVGAKKLAKLQAKADKKAQREAEEKSRQERKKQQEKTDEEQRLKDEKEKEEERLKEEQERRAREEKERREHEEYLKLKEAFAVEEEGFEVADNEEDNLLQEFVDHIKMNKVVVLEDIAAQFKLKTQQAIERIQQLQADGTLTGVVDDRGKFIYISPGELEAVAKFVKQRGRVSIVELVDNSNQLIDLTPAVALPT